MATPYMNLTLPTVSVTAGPLYATENNAAFTVIDSHNHTSGQGAQIPTLGININADLSFTSFNALQLRSTRYVNSGSPLALAADINCVYFSGGELYANDASGNQVKITAGGSVNVSGSGNITGMGATTATVAYTVGNQTFTFSSNTNVKAFISCASLSIATTVASAASVTIASDTLTSGAYTITLPAAVPASNSFMAMSAAGAVSLPVSVTNPTFSGTVTGTNLVANSFVGAIGGSLVLGTSISAYPRLVKSTTNTVTVDNSGTSYPIVVSAQPSSYGLLTLRGYVDSAGVMQHGEGFTSSRSSLGLYVVSFTVAFSDLPAFVGTPVIAQSAKLSLTAISVSQAFVKITDSVGALVDSDFSFITMGQRNG